MLFVFIAFVLGMFVAIMWAKYVMSVTARNAVKAALYDGAIVLPAMIISQMWAKQGDDFNIFIANLVGAMLGTYIVVRFST